MRRAMWAVVALVLVLAFIGCCWWQRDRLARVGLGLDAQLGPVELDADASATVMVNKWGGRRCLPDLTCPPRRHRTYPGVLRLPELGGVNGYSDN